MITKELKLLVKDEAEKLKIHATPEEIEKLDFSTLNSQFPSTCPYGQMTGSCWSKRANELLNICTEPYSQDLDGYEKSENKAYPLYEKSENKAYRLDGRDFSPIEFYTTQENSKNKSLLKFLKGESKTLKL